MPWHRINRALTPLFVVAYVLASTCSGLWHDHAPHTAGHACGHDHTAANYECGSHDDAADHEGCNEDLSAPCDDHSSPDHDSCAVCRFLALSSLAVEPVELTAGGQLALSLDYREPTHFALPLLSTQRSRAPPALV